MNPVRVLLLALLVLAAGTTALPAAEAGHEDCGDYHYPELQRACRLANLWHWCLQQIWWGQPCLWIGLA